MVDHSPPGPKELATFEAAMLLAAIVQDSDDAILTKSLDGIITSWNRGAERLFGYVAAEIIGRPVMILMPANLIDEETSILARLRAGERIDHYETVRQRKDGSLIDISITVSPLRNRDGNIIGASKIARHIGERKRAAEQQQLLLGEMQHRTKNLVAVIEGLARQSRPRNEPVVDAFIASLMGRLRALFSGSELVFASSARRAAILDVAKASLEPFISPAVPTAFQFTGPTIMVSEQTAGGLALGFHELATNALKYGALRNPQGRVALSCRAEPIADLARVHIEWKETGGGILWADPSRRGFGTRVIEAAVSSERDYHVQRDFEPDGFRCRFEFTAPAPD